MSVASDDVGGSDGATRTTADIGPKAVSVPVTSTAGLPNRPFDTRLVPEYDGTTEVVEWREPRAGAAAQCTVCQLRDVSFMSVVPLRLADVAFAVWSLVTDAGYQPRLVGGN